MDIRGIKLTNKDRDHLGNDPFEVLADVIPALDFDYMSKPENGECVVDLGISASPEADEPMVGLWNLTQVDASLVKLVQTLLASLMLAILQIMVQYLQNIPLIVLQLSRRENSDAYAANDAKKSSYGVRDELQASIQTVKALFPVAKQKIPSRIYFDFWIRRIQELKFLQTRVTKQRPSNACNLTLLNMYLIKSIVTNPHEDSFTRSVLQDLNFQPSSQRFGIFFLTTLHHHTPAVHQMEQDDDAVIQHVTSTNGKHKQCQKDIEEDPRRTEEYPLGTHPSWHEITDILYTNPTLITENWEDILNFWTVKQIQDTFHSPAFLPHNSHWKGLPDGPKQLSFGERFNSFFPPLEAEFLTSSSEHDILCLRDGLQAAFELLECLPDKKTGINSQPWKYHPEKGGPNFIVNAKAYKIHGVGPPKKNTNIPHPRAIATHTKIEALLLGDNLNISFNDAAKHIKGNNRQAKKKKTG
ncbi:hypothetical protein M422DRAFT_272295 [Sphaerobolus stellatus SS14]|uniref:Uncharacterized protein n=1 Tax=Sphaerobolus stellatus (strain SS14) TaxID=990650 RepID=A0A0C9UM74_SPHS4|nr:hypothetical protein M422DRAFT_272295 [Sphaerobolus stellatus SS14]